MWEESKCGTIAVIACGRSVENSTLAIFQWQQTKCDDIKEFINNLFNGRVVFLLHEICV